MGIGAPRSGKTVRPVPIIKVEEAPKAVKKAAPALPAVEKQNVDVAEAFTSPKLNTASRALAIVAEEVGLNVSDLAPSASFADFGVDSLLSLNIVNRFREELELEVESSLFADCPTVKDLLTFLPGSKGGPAPPSTVASNSGTMISTPELESTATSTTDETDYSLVDSNEVAGDESNLLATIRLTIAEEVGIPLEEMTSTLAFSDVGLDSLLSLTVLGKLREVLDIELPSSLFQDNNSLNEIEAALGFKPAAKDVVIVQPQSQISSSQAIKHATAHPPATSILLQGNPKTATKILFLFPDGSGSATSYAPLPKLSSSIAVYGLNCPYMKTPERMTCSIDDLTPSYLTEVRRRQPHGPYYFGGWSAGGICAFDAAQQLSREREAVEKLILIDSPFPIGLEKLPPRLYDFFNSIGLFGSADKAPPSWLLPHFLAFVDSLDKYRAVPFPKGERAPETHIIWAKDGVCKSPSDPRPPMRDDDPKEMKWLLNNRTDFSSNGWEDLVGKGRCRVRTMSDANHFTLMEGRKVHELADFVRDALA